jgi:hypothetical protein
MADMVCGLGVGAIFLRLVQSTVSLYIYDSMGKRALSRIFDLTSAAAFILVYVAINVDVPLCAYA